MVSQESLLEIEIRRKWKLIKVNDDNKHRKGASENFTTTLTRAAMGPVGPDLIENTNVTTETSQGSFYELFLTSVWISGDETQIQDGADSVTSMAEPPQRNSAPRILLKLSRAVKVYFMTRK